MIKGCDVSHWNAKTGKVMEFIDNEADFVIIKASEGKSFVDSEYQNWVRIMIEQDIPVFGLYHFCRPDVCSVEQEFANFCTRIDWCRENYPDREILIALDWEGKALNYSPHYLGNFAHLLYEKYAAHPLIYIQKSALSKFTYYHTLTEECGLWIADYKGDNQTEPWKFRAMRQTTSTPFDIDEFYGDIEQLRKYAIMPLAADDTDSEGNCCCCKHRDGCEGLCKVNG